MQYQYVFYLLVIGGAMGTVYDVYNTVSGSSRWLRWLRPVLDLAFWCLSAVAVYYTTFITDEGRFRLYTFALLFIGYFIYRILLHRIVVGSAFAVVRVVRGVLLAFGRLVDVLVLRPIRFVLSVVWSVAGQVYTLLHRLEDVTIWILAFWARILLFPFRGLFRSLFQGWWRGWGESFFNKFTGKWEGMWTYLSNWIKTWPQRE
ncbi:spore cortex biosynthesis protein YabQ [Alicyclobacillus sp. SO9]|uniref:spore cortex biosynthesis protein YabQ n=1 Tax=Alicyclobacillus sp. SO9 TaxID=2665646 RepID=UPI0018E812DF|nr:spore cortex biosynthesis protein YabQ [Alicyclobacillus sp. SO9]QQE79416.1 spore cortex biosynthesis protein YabQ [Alicyclobacillus sp. SO9]